MPDAGKVSRAEYYRVWRKKNPDKVRLYNKRYWERRAEKERAMKNAENANN